MADESTSLFQEIDESLRADRLALFWARNKQTVIGCCIAVVLGTAASVAWRSHADSRAQQATGQLSAAQALLDQGKYADAAAAFGKVAEAGGKQADFARIKEAEAYSAANRKDKAKTLLAAGGKDSALGDLARLQSILLTPPASWNEAQLRELAQPGRPFAATARELLIYHLDTAGSKTDDATQAYKQILSDPQTPASLRQRVMEWVPPQRKGKR
jgi:hypothetical protein